MTDQVIEQTSPGRVANKVALVTGGASGIGRSCARRLAEEGATVIVTDIQDEMGSETVGDIVDKGDDASYLHHDVTSEEQWKQIIADIVSQHGALHILVNNAGIGIGGSIIEMELEAWRRQQAINLEGVFLGVKHAIPAIRDSGGGSIVNMSSVAGLKGSASLAAYNATKGGVRLFTKGVALECAQSGWGVRVNSVHPGIIETPIWNKFDEDADVGATPTLDPEAIAAIAVPGGRLGSPDDIANGVLFLASDEASYITGTELVIDGGLSA